MRLQVTEAPQRSRPSAARNPSTKCKKNNTQHSPAVHGMIMNNLTLHEREPICAGLKAEPALVGSSSNSFTVTFAKGESKLRNCFVLKDCWAYWVMFWRVTGPKENISTNMEFHVGSFLWAAKSTFTSVNTCFKVYHEHSAPKCQRKPHMRQQK